MSINRFRRTVPPPDDAAFKVYKESQQYIDDIESALEPILQLDMSPNGLGLLQRQGVVKVLGFDLIERRNRKP